MNETRSSQKYFQTILKNFMDISGTKEKQKAPELKD